MYTIMVCDDNTLRTTQRERIMQRSKLVDKLHFLVPPKYNDLDMSATTVVLEYVTPSKEYAMEILTKSEALYKEYLEYLLPIDTNLTKESGDVELQLSFMTVSMDADGNVSQHVRKTEPTILKVIPIANWSLQIADSALTPLDQRIVQLEMIQAQQQDTFIAVADSVPDDLTIKDGKVYLSTNGKIIDGSCGVDVMLPRTPDTSDGKNDGLHDLDGVVIDKNDPNCDCGCDHDNFEELDSYVANGDNPYGNFTEL